jgi:hypothetical protein
VKAWSGWKCEDRPVKRNEGREGQENEKSCYDVTLGKSGRMRTEEKGPIDLELDNSKGSLMWSSVVCELKG